MKHILNLIIFVFFLSYSLIAQEYFNEDFSSNMFPPDGWTIEKQRTNWDLSLTNRANSSIPEIKFVSQPFFTDTTRLILPEIDLSETGALIIEFKHIVDHRGGSFKIGLAKRSGNGIWSNIWEEEISQDKPSTQEWIRIDDYEGSGFDQFSFYFDGNSENIKTWHIDDIFIYEGFEKDVKTDRITLPEIVAPWQIVSPEISVRNVGSQAESFDIICTISDDKSVVYSENRTVTSLGSGELYEVVLSQFSPPSFDTYFTVKVTTSLDSDMNPLNDQKISLFNTKVRKRIVLWEGFTNTGCNSCATQNPTTELVITEEGENNILPIIYNINSPDPNDPFYLANPIEISSRRFFYNFLGVPHGYLDGVSSPLYPWQYNDLEYLVDERLDKFTTVDLSATFDDYKNLTVNYEVINKLAGGNYKLHAAIVEKNLHYQAPNGETEFNYVFRKMFPDALGTPVSLSEGAKGTIIIPFFYDYSWDPNELTFIVFIQDHLTFEVVQTTKATYFSPVEVKEDSENPKIYFLAQNFPNPFNPTTTINFSIEKNDFVSLSVTDISGRVIKRLVNNNLTEGNHSVKFEASNLSSGIYFYNLKTSTFSETKKMLLLR